uniref:Uncharacterized protein n=1 Tax=Candidatus Kentrum sp. LPFa TaxID=2126335 RepID=A0A450VYL6_9GAMM|nr:MAG: hypothetical protein BECKLPF1236A_GA0070988_1002912 [Candidatus Kentron sp. LPFa]VFK26171.1 MAG: hypothetical protein BECKLPF1236C_GA0070990_1003112 [Candidatus Kentron sp. LPFa]
MLCFFKDFYYHHATNSKRGVIPLARESSNKYFLAIEAPSMALDPVPAFAGMTYPYRDDGIVEFGSDFQIGA